MLRAWQCVPVWWAMRLEKCWSTCRFLAAFLEVTLDDSRMNCADQGLGVCAARVACVQMPRMLRFGTRCPWDGQVQVLVSDHAGLRADKM